MTEFAAVVLAGGSARRMGGVAKPARPVGGVPLLVRVLEAARAAGPRIVVGPPSLAPLLPAGVRLTIENPPGGGPVAAVAAGVRLLTDAVPEVALLAADLPFLDETVLLGLRARLTADTDAAVLVDPDGRPQWLCSVWRRPGLTERLTRLGDPTGRAMRDLVDGVRVERVTVSSLDRPPAWFDCDTEDDVRRAEEWVRGEPG